MCIRDRALITIIPANEPLIIKATTLNKDIGFLKEGQKVAFDVTEGPKGKQASNIRHV